MVAGVDGGQSSTTAVVADGAGRVLGRGTGPAADLVGVPRDSSAQARAIDAALGAARRAAGLGDETVFDAVVCGISGYEDGEIKPVLQTRTRHLQILHDSEIAFAGALGGKPGIVVIAGTGSVALGVDDARQRVRVGGWGFLFGDEGGAFWMARRAATLAMRRADRGETSALGSALLSYAGVPTLRALQQAFAHGELTRSALAAFAPLVLHMARTGDIDAHLIRSDAARALAYLVWCAHAQLAPVAGRLVSYTGGVFADDALRDTWREAVIERIADAAIGEPHAEPALGAVGLAQELAHA
jgi:glucosamine kinase